MAEGKEKKGFFKRLVEGLSKTRENIVSGIDSIFSGYSSIDDDFYEEIEEILVMGDIGINTTTAIIERLKEQVAEKKIKDPQECKQLLMDSIKAQMAVGETAYEFENRKSVILVIGVNGVGKTTSVGKLAGKLKDQGKKVIMAAADTFRAAAGEQLTQWANRAGVELIGGQDGADPASVVYDAIAAAKARNADVLICSTASPTDTICSTSSVGISISNSSSIPITIWKISRESAPKSSTKVVSGVTSSVSTFKTSAIIFCNFSNSMIYPPKLPLFSLVQRSDFLRYAH